MRTLLLAGILVSGVAQAAPFIVTDPAKNSDGSAVDPAKVTCVVQEAGLPEAVSPLVGLACHSDVGGVTVGTHNVQILYRFTDALWGASDSPKLDFSFTRPNVVAPLAPTGPRLEAK